MSSEREPVSILVVDDDEVVSGVLGRTLERDGYSVLRASSPSQALGLTEHTMPRLALVDLCYPDGDGAELARDLHARCADLPVILMTAYPLRLRERPEVARAFQNVLHKPINLDELRQTLGAALGREAKNRPAAAASHLAAPPVRTEETMESSAHTRSSEPAISTENNHAASAGSASTDPPSGGRWAILKSAATAVFVVVAFVGLAAFVLRIPLPWQSTANAESAASAKTPPPAGALASVELVAGKPHTLFLPRAVRESLGIRNGQTELLAGARPPKQNRAMVLPGSTALDPTRLWRIRARFAPARVVEIAQVTDATATEAGGQTVYHELTTGDHVVKGDLLGVFYSVDVGNKKNDLIDALYQLKLDEEILHLAEKAAQSGAVPEVFMLNAKRNVEGDRNAIARALSNLRTWDIPDKDIQAVYKEAEEIGKRGGQRDRSKDDLWPRVELRAPEDGIVVERNLAQHEMVVDNTVNLFQIAKVDRLTVLVNVPEDDLPALQALQGKQREWTVSTVGTAVAKGVTGPITEIGYLIDPSQHTAVIKGYIDNPRGLIRAGQFVTATVKLPAPADVVEVPTDAVVDDGLQCVVFVQTDAEKQYYTMRRVELTQRFDNTVFVRSKPFPKDEQRTTEEEESGLLPKEALTRGELILKTGVGELKAALLDKESEPAKGREEQK
jgi:cobalt-zinc-cadmium efflux system membrane fusion protein